MCDFEDFDHDGDPFEDDLLEQEEAIDSEGIENDKEDYVGPGWQEIAVFGALSEEIALSRGERRKSRRKAGI